MWWFAYPYERFICSLQDCWSHPHMNSHIWNLMPAVRFKEIVTEAPKDWESWGMLVKHLCETLEWKRLPRKAQLSEADLYRGANDEGNGSSYQNDWIDLLPLTGVAHFCRTHTVCHSAIGHLWDDQLGKRTNWVPKDMSLVSISKPRPMY